MLRRRVLDAQMAWLRAYDPQPRPSARLVAVRIGPGLVFVGRLMRRLAF